MLMLWIPDKKTLKVLARIKRRRYRRRLARLLLFLFALFGLTFAAVPPEDALQVALERLTLDRRFDFVDWVSRALANEAGRRLNPPLLPSEPAEQKALVETFLAQETQIRGLEGEINRTYAAGDGAAEAAAGLEAQLAGLKAAQAAITPQVELLLAQQVETVLREEGFRVIPPVAFRFVDPPTALILSPRDRIENQYSLNLQPGLDISTRTAVEDVLHQRGDVSSFVTNIGGLGSFPTMVISHPDLIYLIDVIAHEWTHNYLYTFPTNIAWGYQTYPRLTTLNETTASLVGEEISRKVIHRFYPDWVDRLPPLDPGDGQSGPGQPSEFHLAMRRIRQRVDQLLAEGKIDEAEAYMEAERLKLVEQGYNLRRLNQAYFAFHGSYALSPGSVDPTGRQLRQLRAASPSLKAFLNRAGWLNSYDDFLAWLDEAGVER